MNTTTPHRIISVVPSQTELLYQLGLNNEVIGITKFCIHPQTWYITKTKVGGTKQLNLSVIESLSPTLLLANKEENVKEQIEAIERFCPVYCSDINTLNNAYEMIEQIAHLTNSTEKAKELIISIKSEFATLKPPAHRVKAAYIIWKNPYMTVGADTFIHEMLLQAGFENVFAFKLRYPPISISDLIESAADVILLSSEPFPFKEKQVIELKTQWEQNTLLPFPKCIIVDGELFSWYGSRLLHSAKYFVKLRESLFLNDEQHNS